MSLKVPFAASLFWLQVQITNLLEGCTIHLYKNDYTPIDTTVLGNLTEADFDGYTSLTVTGWSAAALNADNKAATVAPLQTWTKSAGATPNTVYGVFMKDGSGNLLSAERNPAGGVLITATGQTYSNLPRYTDKSEF